MKVQIHCHIQPILADTLKKYCREHQESLSSVVAKSVEAYLHPPGNLIAECVLQALKERL